MEQVTLERWLADPAGVTRALFAEGGPVSAFFPNYAPNQAQVDYAANLAQIAARGARPETVGLVTPTEADTGTGKTLAILLVAAVNAVLRGKRALVTSYTRELNRQMAGRDGRVAAQVAAEVTGRPCVIAVRRPRSAFASPTACRAAALRIERDSKGSDEADVEARASAAALRALADWTGLALERARAAKDAPKAYADSFDGLIETFKEEHPQHEVALDRVPFEAYTLESLHEDEEQAAYEAYRDSSHQANVLIATHAILVIDQSCNGAILDPRGQGWSLVVCDEANRLESAGRSAMGVKRSIAAIGHDHEEVLQAVGPLDLPEQFRHAIANHMLDHREIAVRLVEAVRQEADLRAPRPERGYKLRGDEPWLADVDALVESTEAVIGMIKGLPGDVILDLVTKFLRRQADLKGFLDCVGRMRRMASYRPGQEIPSADRAYAVPVVDLSPTRRDPSLVAVPKRGSRVIARLWRAEQVRADAVVLTSATLAAPNVPGFAAYRAMLETVGLSLDANNVSRDLAKSFRQRSFGRLVEVVLADPDEVLPSQRHEEDEGYRSPLWLAYVADGIKAAFEDRWNKRSNRVFVLATSFDEAAAIGGALEGLVPSDRLRVRGPDDPLRAQLDWLEGQETGVLVAVGAWDGIDRPGLIDHLLVPRLPFPAPGLNGKAGVFTWVQEDGTERVSSAIETMLMLLVQGLGRPFRRKDDAAKVWILDPRIGLPQTVQREHGILPHERSKRDYLTAFPRRFEPVLAKARIFKRVRPLPKGRGKEAA